MVPGIQPLFIDESIPAILFGGEKLVELGQLVSERRMLGKTAVAEISRGLKLITLIEAYNNGDLTIAEKVAVIHCIRQVSGQGEVPSLRRVPLGSPFVEPAGDNWEWESEEDVEWESGVPVELESA